ncbi:hypothetical protein ACODYM_29060 [Burkholderia gladioli]|uniref:hypothetical protein n=1 Tax=Burkholderia gladioli TaxID=28095 RepID=UPI003B50D312
MSVPTKPGFYWVKRFPDIEPQVAMVSGTHEGGLAASFPGDEAVRSVGELGGAEWSGEIVPPAGFVDWQYAPLQSAPKLPIRTSVASVEVQAVAKPASEWRQDYPDWRDAGEKIELELEDGRIVSGELEIDAMSDGEGDEFPLCTVRQENGEEVNFGVFSKWRII